MCGRKRPGQHLALQHHQAIVELHAGEAQVAAGRFCSRPTRSGHCTSLLQPGASLPRMPVARSPSRPLVEPAWRLKDQVRISDARYVASAELVDASLLTTDRRESR
jgi:predicted nucleic acid-binding protein